VLAPANRLVSVVTPAFNAAPYLADTVRSCLAQTYKEFELLIVDDGSTDATASIAEQFASADNRVRVFRGTNGGVSAARNIAFAHASGAFVALLDSDDVWMPTYLAEQLATLQKFPTADVVTANAINLGGHRDGTPYWPLATEVRPLAIVEMITREDAVCIMSVFRRSVLDRAGGFDERLSGNEDYDFWLRAAMAGCRFVADFTPKGYYRRRPDGLSSDERRMLSGIITVLNQLRPHCPDEEVVAAVDAQVKRFSRALLLAEAKHCLSEGTPRRALEYLKRIPAADRPRGLSLALALAPLWPSLLSGGYRMKRALPLMRARFARRATQVSLNA
jgi:glycosyltransferase involved in cell wall biosynthesis